MKDAEEIILYVGKAKNLKTRLKQYFDVTDSRAMIPFLISKVKAIETIITSSEKEALLLENTLIKKHQPQYNALLKDDKTFVSLMVNHQHKWPMLKMIRYKGAPKKDGLYFGPYTNTLAAKETFDILSNLFPLRQCSDNELISRKRPCLLYSIKRCLAPCVNKCSEKEYRFFVDQTIQFLKGHDQTIVKSLKEKMQKASDNLEFEKAGELLKTIKQLEFVQSNNRSLVHSQHIDSDVLGLYRHGLSVILTMLTFREGKLIASDHFNFLKIIEDDTTIVENFILQHYTTTSDLPKEILVPFPLTHQITLKELLEEHLKQTPKILCPSKGEKKELINLAYKNAQMLFSQNINLEEREEEYLQQLQQTLSLTRFPMMIECFDTSNLSGTNAVASLVAFKNGRKDSGRYRTYKIKGDAFDDYNALKEVLYRRYLKGKENEDLPDLIIVDGGKGQLHVAESILKELGIASCDLIALAKEDSRHDKGLSQEKVFVLANKDPIIFPKDSPVLFLLQQIRDEAHRKAISMHRKQREKRILSSELDSLTGIGPKKKEKLLKHFGSVKKIKEACKEEFLNVTGLSKKDIETLIEFQK